MSFIYQLIHPDPQIYVAHQMNPDECDKIGHVPVILCLVFEVLEQQYGNHGRPNLTHHGILVCSDKGLDAQMLFYGLKKIAPFSGSKSGRQDSNLRHPAPKAGALPG